MPTATPLGNEFLVNTFTTGNQGNPSIAVDADGDFVVVWTSENQVNGSDVFAQRYNSSGVAQGAEFRVNTYTSGNQIAPDVAMNDAGDFTVVWTSQGQDGDGDGVYGQRYNAAGVAQGSEFRVSTYTAYNQNDASIAMDSNGDFVVSWSSGTDQFVIFNPPQDGAFYGVYFQRYNASGVKQGSETRANNTTNSFEALPSVAMDDAGNFVITWTTLDQDGDSGGVYARRYNANGSAIANEFRVNNFTVGDQFYSEIGMDATGNFVIAWGSTHLSAQPDVFARRYNSSGTAQGVEFQVSQYAFGEQFLPTVFMDQDGDFVITWNSGVDNDPPPTPQEQQDGSFFGIYARRYLSSGTADGNEFQVNQYTLNSQVLPVVAGEHNGDFVITWTSDGQIGSNYETYARRYSLNQPPIASAGGPYAINEGDSPSFSAAGSSDPEMNPLTYAWDINNDGIFTDATGVAPTLSWSQLQALGVNDGNNVYPIYVRVDDGFGGVTISPAATLTITNVPPNSAGITTAYSNLFRGEVATFFLTATDISAADSAGNFTYDIDWDNNGSIDQTVVGPNNTPVTRTYNNLGTTTIRVRATDKDGGVGAWAFGPTITTSIYVLRTNGAVDDLYWGGTSGAEAMAVTTSASPVVEFNDGFNIDTISGVTGNVNLYLNDGNDLILYFGPKSVYVSGGAGEDVVGVYQGTAATYTFEGGADNDGLFVDSANGSTVNLIGGAEDDSLFVLGGTNLTLNIQGNAGNDFLLILPGVTTAGVTQLNGGDGDDIVVGGQGSDSLVGGIGRDILMGAVGGVSDAGDTLIGGDGNDVLIGQGGADSLVGGAGEDLLLAGEIDGSFFGEEPFPGIAQVWEQWKTNDPVTTRRDYLTGFLTGGIVQPEFTLINGATIFDDNVVDTISGGSDDDWFIYDFVEDIALDIVGGDLASNIN